MPSLKIAMLAALLLVVPALSNAGVATAGADYLELTEDSLAAGKEKLAKWESKSQSAHSADSGCWATALTSLRKSCSSLDEPDKRRLALSLANCHLHASGRSTVECTDDMAVRQCTSAMGQEAFLTYTEFFTHADNICHFLQSKLWREATKRSINALSESSERVTEQLQAAGQAQQQLLSNQEQSLANEQQLLAQQAGMLEGMAAARQQLQAFEGDVQQSFSSVTNQVEKQGSIVQAALGDIFAVANSVLDMQHSLLGEFYPIQACLFYVAGTLLAWLLTSTAATSRARLWLFTLMTANFLVERTMIAGGLLASVDHSNIHSALWLLRRVTTAVGLMLLLGAASTYRDLNAVNNEMLRSLCEHAAVLRKTAAGVAASSGESGAEESKEGEMLPALGMLAHVGDEYDHSSDGDYVPAEEEEDDSDWWLPDEAEAAAAEAAGLSLDADGSEEEEEKHLDAEESKVDRRLSFASPVRGKENLPATPLRRSARIRRKTIGLTSTSKRMDFPSPPKVSSTRKRSRRSMPTPARAALTGWRRSLAEIREDGEALVRETPTCLEDDASCRYKLRARPAEASVNPILAVETADAFARVLEINLELTRARRPEW